MGALLGLVLLILIYYYCIRERLEKRKQKKEKAKEKARRPPRLGQPFLQSFLLCLLCADCYAAAVCSRWESSMTHVNNGSGYSLLSSVWMVCTHDGNVLPPEHISYIMYIPTF